MDKKADTELLPTTSSPKKGKSSSPSKPFITDLQPMVEKWSWGEFKLTRDLKQKLFLKKKDIKFDIDWSKLKWRHEAPKYMGVSNLENEEQDITDEKQKEVITGEKSGKPCDVSEGKAKVLFKTVFENKTAHDQDYSFKTERSTSSTCSVVVENGVTMGTNFSLTLQTPGESVVASAGFTHEVSVTSTESEEVTEVLTWSIDTQIKVPKNTKTTAQLEVTEFSEKDTYTIDSYFYGDIHVDLYRKKDNSYITHQSHKIHEIIRQMAEYLTKEEKKALTIKGSWKNIPHPVVVYQTKGTAIFKIAANQRVELKEEKLNAEGEKNTTI